MELPFDDGGLPQYHARYGDGNKRIWPTEFGWAAGWTGQPGYEYAKDNTPDEQAQWTVRAYQMMRNWGFVGPAFLWNLNYNQSQPGSELAQWGIMGPARIRLAPRHGEIVRAEMPPP